MAGAGVPTAEQAPGQHAAAVTGLRAGRGRQRHDCEARVGILTVEGAERPAVSARLTPPPVKE